MTQSGQVTLFDWPETLLGVVPSGPAPTGKRRRFTSENLLVAPVLTDSPEITAGNEPTDPIQNGFEGGGEIGVAWSPRNSDDWLESLQWNTFADPAGSASTPVRAGGTAAVTWNPTTRTLTTSGTWTNTPAVGDKILVWGSTNAYLNSIHTVESATSATIVLEQDGLLSDAARVPAISVAQDISIIRPTRLTNSLTPTRLSRGFEKRTARVAGTFLGVTATPGAPTTDFSVFLGGLPTRVQIQGSGEGALTAQWSWQMQQQIDVTGASSPAGATVMAGTTEPDATPIFDGVKCIKKCRFYVPAMSATAGDPGKIQDTLRMCPQSVSIELANGLITTQLMCAQPERDYQFGEPLAQFQIAGIYDSPFSRLAFNQQLDGVFEMAIVATNGEGYLIKLPRARCTASRNDTTGRKTIVQGQMTIKNYAQVGSPAAGDSARSVEIYRFLRP